MILDMVLNESSNDVLPEGVELIEGYTFENGGATRIVGEMLAEMGAINIASQVADYQLSSLYLQESYEEFAALQEGVVKSTFEKLKKMIKTAWGKFVGFLSNVKLWLDKFTTGNNFLKQHKAELKNASTSGVEFEGYVYTLDKLQPMNVYQDAAKVVDDIKSKVATNANNDEAAKLASDKDGVATGMFKAIDSSATDRADVKSYFYKTLRDGKDSKGDVTGINIETVISDIETAKSLKTDIEKLKKDINVTNKNTLKSLDTLEKACKEGKDDNGKENEKNALKAAEVYKQCGKLYAGAQALANDACAAKITAIKERASQSKALAYKILSSTRKGKKDAAKEDKKVEAQNNSANIFDSVMAKFM